MANKIYAVDLTEKEAACVAGDVYYGEGLRRYSPRGKLSSVVETLGGEPKRLWTIFSHIYGDEVILQGLYGRGYTPVLGRKEVNASAYFLVRDQ